MQRGMQVWMPDSMLQGTEASKSGNVQHTDIIELEMDIQGIIDEASLVDMSEHVFKDPLLLPRSFANQLKSKTKQYLSWK